MAGTGGRTMSSRASYLGSYFVLHIKKFIFKVFSENTAFKEHNSILPSNSQVTLRSHLIQGTGHYTRNRKAIFYLQIPLRKFILR